MSDPRLKRLFASPAQQLDRSELTRENVMSIYRDAVAAGHVLPTWSIAVEVMKPQADAQVRAEIAADAAREYPGFVATDFSLRIYCETKYANPAIVFDEASERVLMILPVTDKTGNASYLCLMKSAQQMADTLRADLLNSHQQLHWLREHPGQQTNGVPENLARAKGRLLADARRVFAAVTGIRVADPIADRIAEVLYREEKAVDMNMARCAIFDLVSKVEDLDRPETLRRYHDVDDLTTRLADAARYEQRNLWIFRN